MNGISERRESFSGSKAQDGSDTADAKTSVIDELKQRQNRGRASEAVPEEAVDTPGMPIPDPPQPMDNPDKVVSAAQDEDASLKPADTKSKEAVSGGGALKKQPSSAGSKSSNTAAARSKPAAISTSKPAGPAAKSSASKGSPKTPPAASKPAATKAPRQSTTGNTSRPSRPSAASSAASPPDSKFAKPRSPTRPVNIPTHLTKPTASSAAKHEPEEKDQKANAKDGPRATTKPVGMPSRLMAGTASSNAKHDEDKPQAKPSTSTRTSMASAGTRPRASLAGSKNSRQSDASSREAHQAEKKSAPPPSGDFLARMMRPTASSANHTSKNEEAEKPKSSAQPRASHTREKTTASSSKPTSKPSQAAKKPSRPSAVPTKTEDSSVFTKAEEQVKEKVTQAKDTLQEKLHSSHSEKNEQAKGDEATIGSQKLEETSRKKESPAAAAPVSPVPDEKPAPTTEPKSLEPQVKPTDTSKQDAALFSMNSEQPAVPPSSAEPTSLSADKSTPPKTQTPSQSPKKASGTPKRSSKTRKNPSPSKNVTPAQPTEPVPLTQAPSEVPEATVPEATTSSDAETKPEVDQMIPPVPLTSTDDEPSTLTSQHDGTVTSPPQTDMTASLSKPNDPASSTPSKKTTAKPNTARAMSEDDREAQQLREMINSAIANPDADVSATEQAGKEQAIEEKHEKERTPEVGVGQDSNEVANEGVKGLEATPALDKSGEGEIR
ncbi:MAG: hypothetical protein Q9159_001199 [Coniocarpon cinnabarinum]